MIVSAYVFADGVEFAPEAIGAALDHAYADAAFVRLLGRGGCADTKNVTRTNFIDIGWQYDPRTGRVILMSAEDNLGKGAGGQRDDKTHQGGKTEHGSGYNGAAARTPAAEAKSALRPAPTARSPPSGAVQSPSAGRDR